MIDKEALTEIVKENLERKVCGALHEYGFQSDLAEKLFSFISRIYRILPPELVTFKLRIIVYDIPCDYSMEKVVHIEELKTLINDSCAIIRVSPNTCILKSYNMELEKDHAVQYYYNGPLNEEIYIGPEKVDSFEYFDSASCSVFSSPTYKELDESLVRYDEDFARNSMCGYLNEMWVDGNRMELKEKPEHFMRDSLFSYLRAVLRNHTVKREQVVDASHPVDIKVTWQNIMSAALIEIKWLGDSGKTKYRDARANEGSQQLLDYISSSKNEEPDKNFLGYLVVFDARRGHIFNQYQNIEIKYGAEYLTHPLMRFKRLFLSQKQL